jgi:hypothetical protein
MPTTNINVNRYDYGDYYRGRETVAAVFDDRTDAERAINALKDAGFPADGIGVALRDRDAQGALVEDTGVSGANVAGGAATGALGGGLLGGALGWLVGIGALAIPGIGPVVAGGALATAFGIAGGTAVAGAGIGAAAGGLVGALVGMGIPEEEARYFEGGFQSGRTLVTVRAGANRSGEAVDILRAYGGDIGPASRYTTTMTGAPAARAVAGSEPAGRSWETVSAGYRQDWEQRQGSAGGRWEEAEPGYRYGHELASDARYGGRTWAEVEPEAQAGYKTWAQRSGYAADDAGWTRLREQVREAWDRSRAGTWTTTDADDVGRAV